MYKTNAEIDKMFNEKFRNGATSTKRNDEILSFLHTIREKDREAIREWAKNEKNKPMDNNEFGYGYEQALDDVLTITSIENKQ